MFREEMSFTLSFYLFLSTFIEIYFNYDMYLNMLLYVIIGIKNIENEDFDENIFVKCL